MRGILTLVIAIPVMIGCVIGFIVSPFILGFMVGYEFIAEHMNGAHKRNEERTKRRAGTIVKPEGMILP